MKQGTNFLMDVDIEYDLDEVQHIDFIFVQGQSRKLFHYPSLTAIRKVNENKIELKWTIEDSFIFSTKDYVKMDTLIKLTNSDYNPPTNITLVRLSPTLFTKSEIINHDTEVSTND